MGIGKKVKWAGGGWAEVIRQRESFLLICVCLWGGGWAGWA